MIEWTIVPSAEEDILGAQAWYEAEKEGLGSEFSDELRRLIRRIAQTPKLFPDIGGARRALLHRFPYAVYYVLEEGSRAVVIAVLHQRRKPTTWKSRRHDLE